MNERLKECESERVCESESVRVTFEHRDVMSSILLVKHVCLFVLFVCYGCGTPESPLPLNPGQGSDSPGKIAATRSISVRG